MTSSRPRSRVKPDLPYLWEPIFRGKKAAYYRRAGRVERIRGPDGKPVERGAAGFLDAYNAIHRRFAAPTEQTKPQKGSLAALVAAYRDSDQWADLAEATRKDYDKALRPLETRFGRVPVREIERDFVLRLQKLYSRTDAGDRTPRRANRMVDVLRLLLSWGVDRRWRKDNPALRPGKLKTGPGYATWTETQFAQFMASAPEPLRRAAALGLYTGQRKQDCLAMTREARAEGAVEVVQIKTGAHVWIPEHPALTAILDAAPAADVILTRPDGEPWKEDHFNHAFAAAVRAAGLSGLSFHGLRKAAASRLAEAGCTASEIAAITGHRTLGEVTRYTAAADQKRRARAAMDKLQIRSLPKQ